jgi:hypothetical protein
LDLGYWLAEGPDQISSLTLPVGSIVNSATFRVDLFNPQPVLIAPANGSPQPAIVTVDTSYALGGVHIWDQTDNISASGSGSAVSFTPASPRYVINPSVGGTVSISLTNVTFPPCPPSAFYCFESFMIWPWVQTSVTRSPSTTRQPCLSRAFSRAGWYRHSRCAVDAGDARAAQLRLEALQSIGIVWPDAPAKHSPVEESMKNRLCSFLSRTALPGLTALLPLILLSRPLVGGYSYYIRCVGHCAEHLTRTFGFLRSFGFL